MDIRHLVLLKNGLTFLDMANDTVRIAGGTVLQYTEYNILSGNYIRMFFIYNGKVCSKNFFLKEIKNKVKFLSNSQQKLLSLK